MAVGTVKIHLRHIFEKTGVRDFVSMPFTVSGRWRLRYRLTAADDFALYAVSLGTAWQVVADFQAACALRVGVE